MVKRKLPPLMEKMIRVRDFVKTNYIVELNSVLRDRHRLKLEGTPFKWCLRMERPVDISKPLLREMLRRWVTEFKGFRVMQHLVPFRCVDVCICLGLSVVGAEVEFDDELCGEVGSMFDGEAVTVESIICKMKSLLSSDEEDKVDGVCRLYILICFLVLYFPTSSSRVRALPFKLLDDIACLSNYNWGGAVYTFLIDAISRSYEVYVQQQNKHAISLVGAVPVMQLWAVEHLSLGPVDRLCCFPRILEWPSLTIRTGSIESAFENNKEWDLSEEHKANAILRAALNLFEGGMNDEGLNNVHGDTEPSESAKEKLENNDRRIALLEAEIEKLREDFFRHVRHQSSPVGVSGDGREEVRCEHSAGERRDLQMVPINASDTIPLEVDRKLLYKNVTSQTQSFVFAEINGQLLRTEECSGFRPRGKIDNMAMLFAVNTFMYSEKRMYGSVKRVVFSPHYATMLIENCKKSKKDRRVWTVNDYKNFLYTRLISMEDILRADYLFFPVVNQDHWWCYAVKCDTHKIFILDALGHKWKGRKKIDNYFSSNIVHMFSLLLNGSKHSVPTFEVHEEDVPLQPNLYDCGVCVMKYIEMWDANNSRVGKPFPAYTCENLQDIRKQYICEWVMDEDNIHRDFILKHFTTNNLRPVL